MKKRTPKENKKIKEQRLEEVLKMEFPNSTEFRLNNILKIEDPRPSSLHIWTITYQIKERILTIPFVNYLNKKWDVAVYNYYGVPEEEFHRLEYACKHKVSIQQIFCKKIKGKYPYKKVED